MLIKTQGLVIKQRNLGENDRMITILTKEYGIIEASARGVKRMKSPLAASTQLLCYAEFCIFQGKKYQSINSAETIRSFYDLRLDVVKLSLASYFCDLTSFLSLESERSWVYLRFMLNTLALLEQEKKAPELLKCIFELKAMSLSGFMPDLTGCSQCMKYEEAAMLFLPVQSVLLCGDCFGKIRFPENGLKYTVTAPVLYAMRHIIYSDDKKLFSFDLKGDSLKQLSFISENYVLIHLDRPFKTLDVYKQMLS